jgi:DNA-binding beta-propeller fold protein YncE
MKKPGAAIIVLLMVLAACGPQATPTPTQPPPTKQLPPTTTPLPPTATPVPQTSRPVLPTATPFLATRPAQPTQQVIPTAGPPSGLGEEEYRNAEGGYALLYPQGWLYEEFGGYVLFYANAEVATATVPAIPIVAMQAGPLAELGSGEMGDATDARGMLDAFLGTVADQLGAEPVGDPADITVGGEQGASLDVAGATEGESVYGRIVTAYLGERGLLLFAVGATAGWETFAPSLDAMIASLHFFPPEVPTGGPEPTPGLAPTLPGGPPEGFIWRIGGEATYVAGTLSDLSGLDVGPDGNLYVADGWQGVFVISPDGEILSNFGNDMNFPSDVKVSPEGTVYVAAPGDNAVYVFSAEGEQLDKWGEIGLDDGEFGSYSPQFLAVCPDGRVYVADSNEDANGDQYERVQVFDADGQYLDQWNITEIDDFFRIAGMDCAPDGNIYLSNFMGDYVMVLDAEGKHLTDLGQEGLSPDGAQAVVVDPDGYLYVGTWKGWVGMFDPSDGSLLEKWGVPYVGDGDQAEGQLVDVVGITVDAEGNIYIACGSNGYTYLTKFTFAKG